MQAIKELFSTFLNWGLIGCGVFLFFFSLFKAQQSRGAALVNEIRTEFGGGSFLAGIGHNLRIFFWAAMALIVSPVLLAMGSANFGSGNSNKQDITKIEKPDITKIEKPVEQESMKNNAEPVKTESSAEIPVKGEAEKSQKDDRKEDAEKMEKVSDSQG